MSFRGATCASALRRWSGAWLARRAEAIRGTTAAGMAAAALAAGWAAGTPVALAAGDPPSSQIRATFGAWQMRCQQPPGAKQEKCVLVQSVRAEGQPHLTLTVIYLHAFDGKTRVLRVVAPLGVLLPTGLGLKIDSTDVGHVPFLKCVPNGCLAEVVVNEDLVGKLKTGANAAFILFQTPDYGVGIPVPLSGFGQGIDALR